MRQKDLLDKGQLVNRLASQVGSRERAVAILQSRGHLAADGKTLTEEGIRRDSMTASDRAIDRAARRTGRPHNHFYYDQFTNTAKLLNK
jgi:hypothetical protein